MKEKEKEKLSAAKDVYRRILGRIAPGRSWHVANGFWPTTRVTLGWVRPTYDRLTGVLRAQNLAGDGGEFSI